MTDRHKHLIIGGGFGGLRVARLLANRDDIEVVVVSPQAHFEYHGSLYRSANGYSPLETVIPYREILQDTNVELVQDFMVDINPEAHLVQLLSGRELIYDTVTLALGYEPEYFGIPGMREFSKTLYSLADALELRKTLKHIAEQNFQKPTPAKIVVVGGGPTGIETVASIPYFFELVTGDRRVEVTLIEAQNRILSGFDEKLSRSVEEEIASSVNIYCEQKVIRATKRILHLAGSRPLPFDVLIWTAGSSANGYFRQRPDLFETDQKGRVLVNEYLQSKNDTVYIIGDSAAVPFSGTASAAIAMGDYVASHLIAKLSGEQCGTFQPSAPDYSVPTEHNRAVSMTSGVITSGDEGWRKRRQLDLDVILAIAPEAVARAHWQKGESLASMFITV